MVSVGQLVTKTTSAPVDAAFRESSYPTSLQSVCTSLKTFHCNWTTLPNVITPGESKRVKAIRLRVWLNAHRSLFHRGAEYCCTICIQVRCCWATKLKTAMRGQNRHLRVVLRRFILLTYVHVWTRLYDCYFAGEGWGGGLTISQMNKWNIKLVRPRASFFVLLHYN